MEGLWGNYLTEHLEKGRLEATPNGERAGAALTPTLRRVAALPEEDRKMALAAKEAIGKSENAATMNERSSVLDLGHWYAKPCRRY